MDDSRGVDMPDTLEWHEPHGLREGTNPPPSPFGGAGGTSGEVPPLEASDEEIDLLAEGEYARRMSMFQAMLAAARRPPVRRYFSDYTTKNCEEAYNYAASKADLASVRRGDEGGRGRRD